METTYEQYDVSVTPAEQVSAQSLGNPGGAEPSNGRTEGGRFGAGNSFAVGRGSGRVGSKNGRTTHGLSATTLGSLPRGCSWVKRIVYRLRVELEQAVMVARGELTLKDRLLVQTACRFEQAALLAGRWLRLSGDKMSAAERLSFISAVAAQSALRDRTIEKLRLDIDRTATLLDELYGRREPLQPIEVGGNGDDAPHERHGAAEGTT